MDTIDKLKAISSEAPSNWREKAEWRVNNREWLRVSGAIALYILSRNLDGEHARQYAMEKTGCDEETASEMIKGSHDFTLAEITKLIDYDGFLSVMKSIRDWKEKKEEENGTD